MIKKIDFKFRNSSGIGIFYDSRKDCINLARACNILIDKVNELTSEVNKLNKIISNEKLNK